MDQLQRALDHIEIQNLLAAYCEAIDTRDWDALDNIFTPNAVIDYSGSGGACGSISETKAFLNDALKTFDGMQHMIGLPLIKIDGDRATAKTCLFNPMRQRMEDESRLFFVGLWYLDDLVRIDGAWRISHRRQEFFYYHNYWKDTPSGAAVAER